MTSIQPTRKRPNIRRAVILFPSGLTLGNLFFGIFAIITASRGDFRMAGIYVIWGGIFDALDGRLARVANAGTQFGEELDSLVDAISFGLAPAMIMYFAVLNTQGWDWIFVFLFSACAVMRLARFNIEQAGTAKTFFQGLPSPAAGITLASYYWFSQSWMYSYGAIGDLPWQVLLRFLMATLAFLMISNVPYPVVPRIGFRSLKAIGSSVLVLGSMALLATGRLEFFFPLCIGYMLYGLLRSLVSRMFERRQPTIPYDLSEGEDDDEEDEEANYPMPPVVPARSTRPARPERSAAAPREETRERTTKSEDRAPRPDRKDRPQRTDAERAARREKREKREARGERTPRPPRGETADVGAIMDAPSTDIADAPELVGAIPGGAEVPAATAAGDAPARKRKRRRRRGERKERGPGAVGDESAGNDGDDDGGSDADDRESRSPYAQFPASMPPIPPAVPPQPPSQQPPPSSPANPDSHE